MEISFGALISIALIILSLVMDGFSLFKVLQCHDDIIGRMDFQYALFHVLYLPMRYL
jgi:hypothetical protein